MVESVNRRSRNHRNTHWKRLLNSLCATVNPVPPISALNRGSCEGCFRCALEQEDVFVPFSIGGQARCQNITVYDHKVQKHIKLLS